MTFVEKWLLSMWLSIRERVSRVVQEEWVEVAIWLISALYDAHHHGLKSAILPQVVTKDELIELLRASQGNPPLFSGGRK